MSKIYVVFGEDGEYSDWSTWPVKAFRDEADAEACSDECAKANKRRKDAANAIPRPTSQWTAESVKDMTTGYYKDQNDYYNAKDAAVNAIPHPDPEASDSRLDAQYSVKEMELVE